MSAKKIIIPIVIAAVVGCGVGYYSYISVKADNSQGTSSSLSSTTSSNEGLTNKDVSDTQSSTVSASDKTGATTSDTSSKAISDSNSENTNNETTSSSNATATTNSNDNNTGASNSSNGTNTNSGTITYNAPSESYSPSTVLVENTTGEDISESQLNEYLRSWIMVGQENCQGICDATGTLWSEPWLNKVSQNTMYQAFVDANGESALSQNITANEFIKATQELDTLTENDVPFTFSQAKDLILEMLQEDGYATPSEVTKITFVQGTPSVYEVYTKESGNYVFWTVYANNGYAHD